MNLIKVTLLFMMMFNYLFALDAKMEIVNKGKTIPKILISLASDATNNELLSKVKKLIDKDLLVSGHFRTSDLKFSGLLDEMPNFVTLKKENIDLFLNLSSDVTSNGNMTIHIKLYDVNQNKIVLNKVYTTSSKKRYPFLSHKVSIEINEYLNAPTIKWMDKLIVFSRYKNSKESEIVISDYTLTYQHVVVKGGLNIFPKWTDNTQESFYYTSLNGIMPQLKKQNLYTQVVNNIQESDGMLVCSDVSKINPTMILTKAPNGQPDIYIYNHEKKINTRLTNYKGIDVGGSFVENDTKVVFVSDRLKYPNIFAKTIGHKGVERLVYHGKNNSQCTTFSDYIVYASRETDNEFGRNSFNLYLISTRSDFIRRLTTTGRNQFPKFSKDGDSILFIKNYNNKSYLGIIRVNYNKSFLFPLEDGKLQSIDW